MGKLRLKSKHRLMCGDSTKAEDVDRLGAAFDLCMTDPPYGADIQYATHDDTQDALLGLIGGFFPIACDRCTVVALTPGINNLFHYPKPDWVLCWFYGAGTGRSPWGFTSGEGCHPDGFQFMMSKDDAGENRSLNHACPKPLSVWRRFMERLSNKNTQSIYDPFAGSGTTMIAAEQLGLRSFNMEISPQYVDVCVARFEKLTGEKAVLHG